MSDVIITPAAKKLIAEHGLEDVDIKGSGKEGRVLKADVLAFIADGVEAEVEVEDAPPPVVDKGEVFKDKAKDVGLKVEEEARKGVKLAGEKLGEIKGRLAEEDWDKRFDDTKARAKSLSLRVLDKLSLGIDRLREKLDNSGGGDDMPPSPPPPPSPES